MKMFVVMLFFAITACHANAAVYPVEVVRVVDGDTLQVRVDLGLETFRLVDIRMEGIDAPELPTSKGKAARQWLETYLTESRIWIDTGEKERWTFRRLVARLWVEKSGRRLDAGQVMILNGQASPYPKKGSGT